MHLARAWSRRKQHRQIQHAGNDLRTLPFSIREMARFEGVPPTGRSSDYALAESTFRECNRDSSAAFFHILTRTDADRVRCLLRADRTCSMAMTNSVRDALVARTESKSCRLNFPCSR